MGNIEKNLFDMSVRIRNTPEGYEITLQIIGNDENYYTLTKKEIINDLDGDLTDLIEIAKKEFKEMVEKNND